MKKIFSLILLASVALSCNYNNFENPELEDGTILEVTHTIKSLRAMYRSGGFTVTDSIVIGGQVISSDETGNIYKTLIIQDETDGIKISSGRTGLYNFFKEGQWVYVKCKGLQLGAYGGSVQLGGVPTSTYETDYIPAPIFDDFIVEGPMGEPVVPAEITIAQALSYDNRLVKLTDVQFLESEVGHTWGDAVTQTYVTRHLIDKSGRQIDVRTSGYARFAGVEIPSGSGSVIAVMGSYNGSAQLTVIGVGPQYINMNNPRF